MTDDEDRGRLHVNADHTQSLQPFLERIIPFPHSTIGRVDNAGAVVLPTRNDFIRDELVELETGQGRNLRWKIIVAGSVAANSGDGQNIVADRGGFLQSAALA